MIEIVEGNVLDQPGDALLFSTNERLYLSGGCGGDLIGRYGQPIQEAILEALRVDGRNFGQPGEVFAIQNPMVPWTTMYVAIAVDPFYHSSSELVGAERSVSS